MNGFLDRLGISASLLCILHCVLTPLLVVMVPFVGTQLAHGWFHAVIAAIVVPVAVWALWNGYRQHNDARVLWLGGIGLGFVALALLLPGEVLQREFILMSIGGLSLAGAHLLNLRRCQPDHH